MYDLRLRIAKPGHLIETGEWKDSENAAKHGFLIKLGR